MDELKTVVAQNDKQRFSFNPTETLIRADRRHSVAIDLELSPSIPLEVLDLGTYEKAFKSILQKGLNKMQRHRVHLSSDRKAYLKGNRHTAIKVGRRIGKPVVLKVATGEMARSRFLFFSQTIKFG